MKVAARDVLLFTGGAGTGQNSTLIVVSRVDVVTPREQMERHRRGIPGSALIVFEHSGRLPYLEEPNAFCQADRSWLARTRSPNG